MKIGIEIHQRLCTRKLFCDCRSVFAEEQKPKMTIQRRLHPVFSELGETDEASQSEFAKDRLFEYQVFENNCLVDIDEEPPKLLNEEALRIALEISAHLGAVPVDEVHIMRKMVIDGSNTAGFQRTSIIALNGHVDSSKGPVRVPIIALEEESAGIVSVSESKATYRLDRLGIPLLEISTAPDIKDGAHLQEVAEKIGMVLRTSGKVARGLGTIRQDVNISTEGGARVEIKGAQDLKLLPVLVENEVKRQTGLVAILADLRRRKALPLKGHAVDVTPLFAHTKAALLEKGIREGGAALAQKLPGHGGLLGREIQPGRRYGTELSDYAKMAGVKGIIHGDEAPEKYHLSADEVDALRKALGMEEGDSFVLVVAPRKQAENALALVLQRASMDFVPGETRRANPDGTSTFMRPLPGRGRLYPETDVPPIPVTKELISSVEVGESLEQKKQKLEKMLNGEMAAKMLRSRNLHLFEKLVETGTDPVLAATTLENTLVSLRREGIEFSNPEKTLIDMFSEYNKGSFVKAAIPDVLRGMAKGARAEAVYKVYRLGRVRGQQLEKIAKENDYDLQKIMQKYRLQVDPQELSEIIGRKRQQ